MGRERTIALLEVTFAVIFWGASFIATKVALRDAAPFTIVWLRFGMGVLILGAAVIQRGQLAGLKRQDLAYFALLGFLGITFHQWLQANALETSQATTTAWIVTTSPVFIALLSWLFLKEHLGWTRVGGIALAAVGVLLVVTKGDFGTLALGHFGERGDILILISAVNWAVFTVLSRRGLNQYPAALMMFYVMGIGWLLSTVPFLTGPGLADIGRLTTEGWLGVGFLGIFCSGLAYIFWYDALKGLATSQVGVFLYMEPLVTLVVAAVILQERLTLLAAVGAATILLGVWLVNRPMSRETRVVVKPVSEQAE